MSPLNFRLMNRTVKKTVAAAVVQLDGEILIIRRAPDQTGGMWEFPGGKIEHEETPQQCIVSELGEELDVESIASEVISTSDYSYSCGVIELVAVMVQPQSLQLKLELHDLFEWVLPRELLSYKPCPCRHSNC